MVFKKIIKSIFPSTMHSMSALYLEQVSLSLIVKVFSILISLVYIPIVLGFLNQEKYGIWVTLVSIINWIKMLDIGMGNGMRNKLAESIALKQYDKGRIFISTAYGILGSIFIGVLILFHCINPCLDWQSILNSKTIAPQELTELARIVVSFIVLGFILQPIVLIYEAHGKSAIGGIIQLIINLLTFILVWAVSTFGTKGNIIILAWIVTGIPLLVYGVATIYTFFYKYPHLKPSFKEIKINESGNLLKLSAQFFILQITATIVFASTPFIIAHLFSPNEVTLFSITSTLYNVAIMGMFLIASPLQPLVTQTFAKNEYNWIKSMLHKMNIVSIIISAGTILIVFISPFIFKIWLGDKVDIPFNLSVAIGIYTIIYVINTPFSIFINAIGKIKILVILAPIQIILIIGLSIILSKIIGNVIAVSIALSVSTLVGLIATPLTLKKHKVM